MQSVRLHFCSISKLKITKSHVSRVKQTLGQHSMKYWPPQKTKPTNNLPTISKLSPRAILSPLGFFWMHQVTLRMWKGCSILANCRVGTEPSASQVMSQTSIFFRPRRRGFPAVWTSSGHCVSLKATGINQSTTRNDDEVKLGFSMLGLSCLKN